MSIIIDAVREFALQHNIQSLSDESLDELVGHVDAEDYDAMYETVGKLVSFVPPEFHQELFDVVSSALTHLADPNGEQNEAVEDTDDEAGECDGRVEDVNEQASKSDDELFFERLRNAVKDASDTEEDVDSDADPNMSSTSPNMNTADGEMAEGEEESVAWQADLDDVVIQNRRVEAALEQECARVDKLISELQVQEGILAEATKAIAVHAPPQRTGQSDKWRGLLDEEDGFVLQEEPVREERLLQIAGVFEHMRRRFGESYFAEEDVQTGCSSIRGDAPPSNDDAREMKLRGIPGRMELVRAFGATGRWWPRRGRGALREVVEERARACARVGGSVGAREGFVLREVVEGWGRKEWGMITQTDGWRLGRRSAEDIMCRYLNVDAPWVAGFDRPWIEEEDSKLREICREDLGWAEVAERLGGRTGLSCLRRWRHLQDAEMRGCGRRRWTKEEDEDLRKAVAVVGRGDWAGVALMMGGGVWNGQQCMHRFVKRVGTGRRVGKWESEEVEKLRQAVREVKGDGDGGKGLWTEVARRVGSRSDVQCREKWVNCLDETVRRRGWGEEEDGKLQKAVERIGVGKWAEVAREMGGRTDAQCKRRWTGVLKRLADRADKETRLDRRVAAGSAGTGKRRRVGEGVVDD